MPWGSGSPWSGGGGGGGGGAPTGAAGGDLGGTYPDPTVTRARGLREAGGTTLPMLPIAANEILQRVGTDIDGITAAAIVSESNVRAALAALSANPNFNSKRLTAVADPSGAQDAATKTYADGVFTDATLRTALAALSANPAFNSKRLTLVADPSGAQDAATKAYSDSIFTDATLRTALAALSANPAFNSKRLTLVADPSGAQDAATKAYVDSVAQGLSAKGSVRTSTTAALAANTYSNGALGVGATLTANANGAIAAQDGIALQLLDRILVKNEVTLAKNGVYIVTSLGSAILPYILTRALDMDTAGEFPGAFVFVEEGTVNGASGWVCTADPDAGFVVGTSDVSLTQFSGAGEITAGTGLSKSANTLSIAAGGVQATQLGTGAQIESSIRAALAALTADVTIPALVKIDGYDISVMGARVALMPDSSYATLAKAGSAVAQEGTANFIDGNSASVTVADNAGATRTDITVAVTTTPAGQTAVGATRSISTTAPLTGGGDLSANRTFAIDAATTSLPGSMSAADKLKQDNSATSCLHATIATTDATVTNIHAAIAITQGKMTTLDVILQARKTTDDASQVEYRRIHRISNVSGTTAITNTATPVADFESATPTNLAAAQYDNPTVGAAGTVQFVVHGIAATNLTWDIWIIVRTGT